MAMGEEEDSLLLIHRLLIRAWKGLNAGFSGLIILSFNIVPRTLSPSLILAICFHCLSYRPFSYHIVTQIMVFFCGRFRAWLWREKKTSHSPWNNKEMFIVFVFAFRLAFLCGRMKLGVDENFIALKGRKVLAWISRVTLAICDTFEAQLVECNVKIK